MMITLEMEVGEPATLFAVTLANGALEAGAAMIVA